MWNFKILLTSRWPAGTDPAGSAQRRRAAGGTAARRQLRRRTRPGRSATRATRRKGEDLNQCTDLVELRAGLIESHENIFPLRFPPLSLISGRFRCQKRILRIILKLST